MTADTTETPDAYRLDDITALRERALESLEDPRISNYFSRGHVKASDVLKIIDDEDIFSECRESDSFDRYADKRREIDDLGGKVDEGFGSVNWKSIQVMLAGSCALLLILSELGGKNKIDDLLKILLSLFSVGAALLAGLLIGHSIKSRRLDLVDILVESCLVALSVCAVALPRVFAVFPMALAWPFVDLGGTLVAGVLLAEESTFRDSRNLARAFGAAIQEGLEWRESKKLRKFWLDDSGASILYPNAVLAINRLLGDDSTKLLVEQDSEGLRRLQDPMLTVSTKSELKLRSLIDRMDGGSIAVTGPRGAGKTTLLKRTCDPQDSSTKRQLSVYISAPAEYIAREFLAELFQQICDTYLRRYNSPIAGMRYRGLRTRRDTARAVRGVAAIARIGIRLVLALSLLILAVGPFIFSLHPLAVFAGLPVMRWRSESMSFVRMAWANYRLTVQISAVVLALLVWPSSRLRRRRLRSLRRPELVQRARSYLIHLKIERTRSWSSNLSLPAVRSASFSSSKGVSEKYVPWSLPELVGKLREFISDMSRPAGGSIDTIVVGIDEIDRIGSVEQAEKFIGEVKAIFGIPNCFFLVSVAEDMGFLFSRRSIVGQSTLEHSFDDVVVVDALEFDEARELLSKRVPGFTESFVFLALALSGGLPREMIRVARRLVDANHRQTKAKASPKIGDLAFRLVAEDVAEVIRTSRNQLARLRLPDSWGSVFHRLLDAQALLRNETVPMALHRRTIGVLCSMQSPVTAKNDPVSQSTVDDLDEVAAEKIVVGLSAFASYGLTVIEAFDNNYFNLRAARSSTLDTEGGSYAELATARLELGVSPGSSQEIIRRFRAHSGLRVLRGPAAAE